MIDSGLNRQTSCNSEAFFLFWRFFCAKAADVEMSFELFRCDFGRSWRILLEKLVFVSFLAFIWAATAGIWLGFPCCDVSPIINKICPSGIYTADAALMTFGVLDNGDSAWKEKNKLMQHGIYAFYLIYCVYNWNRCRNLKGSNEWLWIIHTITIWCLRWWRGIIRLFL